MFKLCTRCVMPDTKPDLWFDERGVCSACIAYENRKTVDWSQRMQELQDILARYRSKDRSKWDCVVPVSGGKDSTFQVIKMLQLGLNPLAVTAATCAMSDIGRRNLDNIRNLGVDLIEVRPNVHVRSKLNRIALQQVGDISWPEHVTIFTIPVQVAVNYKIPLIVWGENSQNEYGGPAAAAEKNYLDRRWLEEFGGLLGLRVSDLYGMEGLERKDLIAYTYPSDEEVRSVGVTGLFLGHYIPWDGWTNTMVAQNHGWEAWPKPVEGAALDYENLDNLYHGIHDYFKFLKFGFGRATDHVCMQIRRGRLSREDAMEIVRMRDGKFPSTYLDVPLEKILSRIDMKVEEFVKICDRFTNKKIFKTDSKGQLVKDSHGSLIRLDFAAQLTPEMTLKDFFSSVPREVISGERRPS